LREAAITSLLGEASQSFKDAQWIALDVSAWESSFFLSSINSTTPPVMAAQRTRLELRELGKFIRGTALFPLHQNQVMNCLWDCAEAKLRSNHAKHVCSTG
jgi:hypothetical protein